MAVRYASFAVAFALVAGIALALALLDRSGATPRSVAAATPTATATATVTPTAATTPAPCSNGVAVANPSANPGLVADCAALLLVKTALIGTGTATLNWSESLAIVSWEGLSLTRSVPRRVTHVNLTNKGLTGRIPPQLGDLANLEVVHLSGNRLEGKIPDLRGAAGLQVLVVRNNRLSGEIPAWLGGMTRLRRLALTNNQLTGDVPPELGKLTRLDDLMLRGNSGLTGCVPPPLKTVKNNDIARLGLPDCACWNGTVVASPSAKLGLVADCAALLLVKTALIGEGTTTLNWSESLAIASWEGVTLSSSVPARVTGINLQNKGFAGTLPAALGDIDRLDYLNLTGNSLTGEIPAELGNLPKLGIVHLSGNRLEGKIPDLRGAAGLQVLVIRNNRLSGEIPAWLGGMTRLRRLALTNNRLTGDVPPELGKLTRLDDLMLRGNSLTGCIPPPLKNVKNNDLARLGLPDCACWNGTVVASPSANLGLVADCAALLQVKTALIGEGTATLNWSESLAIASWEGVTLSSSSSVPARATGINLQNKGFAGTLPAALGDLDRLDYLNLTGNSLTGEIPAELGNLPKLEIVHLSGNRLEGKIPDLRGAAGLQVLVVRNNRLSGEIPAWLGGMTRLRRLALTNNQLAGDVPPELGKLTRLDDLMLRGNSGLTGCVPPPLKNVKNNDIARLGLPDCACWNATVVASPAAKLGLVADCAALLEAKAALIGTGTSSTATLNWSESLAIASWESLGFEDGRVSSISLSGKGLAGSIPAALGRLDGLTFLNLARNSLTGAIPEEIGDPEGLNTLYLSGNTRLTCIPSALRNVRTNDLGDLGLPNCGTTEAASTPEGATTPAPSG